METERKLGLLLIAGAMGVMIPYTLLTLIFDYPAILRQDPGVILTSFYQGGNPLILTWWAFAMLGIPLVIACVLLGQKLEGTFHFIRWATTLGVVGLLVQMIGLLRWTFVVPLLARNFVTGNATTKEASIVAFQIVHQYGGVILGEHIGQLFTITWTVMITYAFAKLKCVSKATIGLGYVSSGIYVLAQTELFATIIPGFREVPLAGFVGSTLWILWLVLVGIEMIKQKRRVKPTYTQEYEKTL
ncbi:DUF4386 domain-containing protein [Flavobacterium sp. N1718]|uniref:DUF4386 domain-containing protein n=1 Tax=Flavobacterium sp. N1718 TaxID=2986822 RepID=UPI00222402E8|nr:DUF4386 domain-containing protein [Flavobacterium sp. N1718]